MKLFFILLAGTIAQSAELEDNFSFRGWNADWPRLRAMFKQARTPELHELQLGDEYDKCARFAAPPHRGHGRRSVRFTEATNGVDYKAHENAPVVFMDYNRFGLGYHARFPDYPSGITYVRILDSGTIIIEDAAAPILTDDSLPNSIAVPGFGASFYTICRKDGTTAADVEPTPIPFRAWNGYSSLVTSTWWKAHPGMLPYEDYCELRGYGKPIISKGAAFVVYSSDTFDNDRISPILVCPVPSLGITYAIPIGIKEVSVAGLWAYLGHVGLSGSRLTRLSGVTVEDLFKRFKGDGMGVGLIKGTNTAIMYTDDGVRMSVPWSSGPESISIGIGGFDLEFQPREIMRFYEAQSDFILKDWSIKPEPWDYNFFQSYYFQHVAEPMGEIYQHRFVQIH